MFVTFITISISSLFKSCIFHHFTNPIIFHHFLIIFHHSRAYILDLCIQEFFTIDLTKFFKRDAFHSSFPYYVRVNVRFYLTAYMYVHHSVVKSKIYYHRKNISSIHLFTDFISKNVAFTKFLPKMGESKFSKLPHCDRVIPKLHTVYTNVHICVHCV